MARLADDVATEMGRHIASHPASWLPKLRAVRCDHAHPGLMPAQVQNRRNGQVATVNANDIQRYHATVPPVPVTAGCRGLSFRSTASNQCPVSPRIPACALRSDWRSIIASRSRHRGLERHHVPVGRPSTLIPPITLAAPTFRALWRRLRRLSWQRRCHHRNQRPPRNP
jgi:hypothetical protein